MAKRRKWFAWGGGCGFLLGTCFVTCALLIVNGIVVSHAYNWFAPPEPSFFARPRVAQAILYAGPVALLFIEWWLLDLLVDLSLREVDASGEKDSHK